MPRLQPALLSLAIAGALLSAPAAFGQSGNEAEIRAISSAGVISGQVKEAASGQFLDGARVRLGNQTTTTDRQGRFRFSGLAATSHEIAVDFVGYGAKTVNVDLSSGQGASVTVVLASTTATELERVEVRATRDAQALALNQQRSSANYKNVVSADLLGNFPDANIAESTQRVPGVSIERDQGEGRYVNVRGAPLEFTSVSVDGLQLSAPNPTRRAVELDTIPSDVIAALEVTKAITPDMDGDAIAGQINIVTQSALDRDGPTVRGSLASGRFQLGSGDNDRAKFTLGDRFGADDNIGLLISGSGSRAGRFTENVETTFARFDDGRILPEVTEIKDYEGTRTRTSLAGRADFRIDENHLLYAIGSASKFRDKEYRNNFIIEYERHDAASDDVSGTVGRATFDKELRERIQEQRIRTMNFGGEHYFDTWDVKWQAARSEGEFDIPARQQLIYRSSLRPAMRYDYSNPDFPRYTLLNPDGSVLQEGLNLPESVYNFRRYNARFEQADESENSFRLDFGREQDWIGEYGRIQFGLRARLRDKTSNDDRNRNSSAAGTPAYTSVLCDGLSNNFGVFLVGRVYCNNAFAQNSAALNANLAPLLEDSVVADYAASEDITAGYVRLDATWDRLTMVTGLRYEATEIEGRGNRFDLVTEEVIPQFASNDYGKLLPSLHFRFEQDPDTIWRWSYSTALSRPNYPDTAPTLIIDDDDRSATAGNPNLKPTYSHNFDVSFERYLRPLGLVSVAVFHKELQDPIFQATSRIGSGVDVLEITRPENGDAGRITGVELAWQQTFDFLPGLWNGLGVYANYTYADSEAELPFGIGKTQLPGTSEHNANLAFFYEKHDANLRLSYNWRSEYIQAFDVSDRELNVFWDDRPLLDFTASYALDKQWDVFFEGSNLTDTRQRRYQGQPNRVLELEQFGRSWLVGIRYKL
jgi:TonB-dependent receptor